MNALGHPGGVRLAIDVVEEHGELVAAQTRQGVARPHAAFQPARGPDQQLVAGLVPQAVVDRLEAIEVEIQHGEQGFAQRPATPVKHVLQPVEEQRAVREIGERIVERPVLKLLFRLLALGDVARDAVGSHDGPLPIAQRKLRGRDPANVAVRPDLLLLDVHQRLPGPDDLLLVAEGLLGVLRGEDVEVGPAHRQRGARQPEAHGRVAIDAREAAVAILEVDAVGDVVHQRLQQEDLVLKVRDFGDDADPQGVGRRGLATGSHSQRSSARSPPGPLTIMLGTVSKNTQYHR